MKLYYNSLIEYRNLSFIDNQVLLNVSKPLIYIDLDIFDYFEIIITN